jgi:translation initiation factor IF-3
VRALLVDDAITSDVVQLVSLEGRNLGEVALADAKLLAKQKGLRLACVVPLANPPICRLQRVTVVPDVDELEDDKRGVDDEITVLDDDGLPLLVPSSSPTSTSSTQVSPAPDIPSPTDNIKRRPKGEKELRFSDAIAEHDVQTKVGQLRRFLSKGLRVRVSINFKSVAQFDVDLARALLDNIISRADDLGRVEGDIHIANRFASLLLLPLPSAKGQNDDDDKYVE